MEAKMNLINQVPIMGFVGLLNGQAGGKFLTWGSQFFQVKSLWVQVDLKVMEYFKLPLLRELNKISLEVAACEQIPKRSMLCLIFSQSLSDSVVLGRKRFKRGELGGIKLGCTEIEFSNQLPVQKDLQSLLSSANLTLLNFLDLVKETEVSAPEKRLKTYWKMALKRFFN